MEPVQQRRANPRSRTLLEGHIIYNNRLSRMECTVRDLSEAGARLVFSQPVKVPAEFELQIPSRKFVRRAQIIWYDGKDHGIMFLDDDQDAATDAKPMLLGQGASSVPKVLEEARQKIARLLGMSAEEIELKVEFKR